MKLKNLLLPSLLLCVLTVFSCQSNDHIYSYYREDSEIVFLRNTDVSDKKQLVKKLSFDMTLAVNENGLMNEPVFNYTLILPKDRYNEAAKISIFLESADVKIKTCESKLLYKELNADDNAVVRFSSVFSIEDFEKIMNTSGNCKIVLQYSDGTVWEINSKEFNEKLNEVRFILL